MKSYSPHTPSRRGMTTVSYKGVLSNVAPHKALVSGDKRRAGRNHGGRITMRHQGGGHKRRFRMVDFLLCDKANVPGIVQTIEYDPSRSGFIALVNYRDGDKRYVLAPRSVAVGSTILTAEQAPLTPGNRLFLKHIPVGTFVYNIELKPRGGAKLVRITCVVRNDFCVVTRAAHKLSPTARLQFDVIHKGAYRNVFEEKGVTRSKRSLLCSQNGAADRHRTRREHIPLIAIAIVDEGDETRARGIVLNSLHNARHIRLIAEEEIHHAKAAFVASSLMTHSDASSVVTAGAALISGDERLMRSNVTQYALVADCRHAAAGWGVWRIAFHNDYTNSIWVPFGSVTEAFLPVEVMPRLPFWNRDLRRTGDMVTFITSTLKSSLMAR